jgi:acetylornithine deacetylase/succinyl-diaminopimelate desuccinylase-like protein
VNAISRAFELGRRLESLTLPPPTEAFPLPPQLTITGMHGGSQAFSQVPDLCELRLDMRLTPSFSPRGRPGGRSKRRSRPFDASSPKAAATAIDWHGGWPAYQLAADHALVQAMQQAGSRRARGRDTDRGRRPVEHRQLPGIARRAGALRIRRQGRGHPCRERAHRARQHRAGLPVSTAMP